jgi:tRNA 2-thiouridine synthesizing protein D
MKFAIAVYASPTASDSALTALRFAESVVEQGHELYRLFFFHEGVMNGAALPGEALSQAWQRLIRKHQVDAVVCVTSAKKRGMGATNDSAGLTVAEGFTIGGLGQLIDAAVNADRLITFGD